MSRYSEGDSDQNFPNEAALWRANADRALKGKRGRRALAELREALLALPQKRLIASAMCTVNPERRAPVVAEDAPEYRRSSVRWARVEWDLLIEEQGEGVCAIGAYLWHRKVKAGADPAEAFDNLPTLSGYDDDMLHQTAQSASDAGLAFSLAWDLAYRNDEIYDAKTPEERYEAFLAWLNLELDGVPA